MRLSSTIQKFIVSTPKMRVEPISRQFLRYLPALTVISIFSLSVLLWQALALQQKKQIERKTDLEATSVANQISNQLEERILALIRMAGRWEHSGRPIQQEWERDAILYTLHFGAYKAIAWVDSDYQLRWIEPDLSLESIYDNNASIKQSYKDILNKAYTQRHLVIQQIPSFNASKNTDIVVIIPLFARLEKTSLEQAQTSREDRKYRRFDGFIMTASPVNQLFEILVSEEILQGYAVEIWDGDHKIYEYLDPQKRSLTTFMKEADVNLDSVNWRVRVYPTEELLALEQTHLPIIVLGSGGLIALLMGLVIRQAQILNRRAKKFEMANQDLQKEVEERHRTEQALQQTYDNLEQQAQERIAWVNTLEQRNKERTLLNRMNDLLQACLSTEEATQVVSKTVPLLFPESSGGIYWINNSRTWVEAIANWGETLTSKIVFAPHECLSLRQGQPYLSDETDIGLPCQHVEHSHALSHWCIPMMAQGEALGILYLSFLEVQNFNENQQQLGTMIARSIGLALANLKLRENLRHQSIRDPLTELFNRRYMEESLEREINRATRKQHPIGILMIDVDHFKRFNDTYGHDAGDSVLKVIGQFLQSQVRGGDIACRYGGEELILILPEVNLKDTQNRGEKIREGVKKLKLKKGSQELDQITVSIGVACFPEQGLTGEVVIQTADAALYKAKTQGRDRVVTADELIP
ncbi:diguanylate cyclase domain protein [Lyngbya aestuarii BL J]|uniref:Diguanylate cyclase domain protein n=2 Tax=Lyngbya aestuarii TaxID=118322 RepID=U7QH01_9CYAN|nr:diguanylate cyclase domain protein [Lyngbya aestuarii BL J]